MASKDLEDWSDSRNVLRYYTSMLKSDTKWEKEYIILSLIGALHGVAKDFPELKTSIEFLNTLELVEEKIDEQKDNPDYEDLREEYQILKNFIRLRERKTEKRKNESCASETKKIKTDVLSATIPLSKIGKNQIPAEKPQNKTRKLPGWRKKKPYKKPGKK